MVENPRALVEQSLHSLLARVLEGHRTKRVDHELERAGLDLDAGEPQRLPPARWKRVMELCAHAVFPQLPPAKAQHALAERLVEEAQHTLWGRALTGVARLLGPTRALERTAQAVGQRAMSVRGAGPAKAELWIHTPAVSLSFTEGLLEAGLRGAGAEEVALHRAGNAREGYTFALQWRPR